MYFGVNITIGLSGSEQKTTIYTLFKNEKETLQSKMNLKNGVILYVLMLVLNKLLTVSEVIQLAFSSSFNSN